MKRPILTVFIILFSLSLAALGYTMLNIGTFGESDTKSDSDDRMAIEDTSNTDEDEDGDKLDWMKDIRGYSEDDEVEEEDIKQEEEDSDSVMEESSTSTDSMAEEGDDWESSDAMTDDEGDSGDTETDEDRMRGVENIGRADALESDVYDHGFDKLVLYAEMRMSSIVLDWNATDSDSFSKYLILRSTTDANPYPGKTTPIATSSNINNVSFTDTNVEPGKDYYYRVCFEKTEGKPACGNILLIRF